MYAITYCCYKIGYVEKYMIEDKKDRLAPWRENAREKGKANADKLLLWVFRWGWTTEPVMQKLLNVKRRPGGDFVRRGLLNKVAPPTGHHHPVFILDSSSLTRAQDLYEAETNSALPYPYPRNSIPFAALAEHQEFAQLIALDELADDELLTVERELRVGEPGALPDFQISNGLATRWYEIELTPKYRERLLLQMWDREQARRDEHFAEIHWWCRTAGIARNIAAILSQPNLPHVKRRPDGKIVKGVGFWKPEELRQATHIHIIGQAKDAAIPEGGQRVFEDEDPEVERRRILDMI